MSTLSSEKTWNNKTRGHTEIAHTTPILIVHNRLIPLRNYDAINILGMLFCRKGAIIMADLTQYKRIHIRQMIGPGFVLFHLFYVTEWFTCLSMSGRAYLSISFEREAHGHIDDPNYSLNRRPYVWMRYLKNPSKSRTKPPKKSN